MKTAHAALYPPMRVFVLLVTAVACAKQPVSNITEQHGDGSAATAPRGEPSDPRADALASELRAIAAASDGTVAATVVHLPSGARASVNGRARLPMMSVFKLPLALVMLRDIDA